MIKEEGNTDRFIKYVGATNILVQNRREQETDNISKDDLKLQFPMYCFLCIIFSNTN